MKNKFPVVNVFIFAALMSATSCEHPPTLPVDHVAAHENVNQENTEGVTGQRSTAELEALELNAYFGNLWLEEVVCAHSDCLPTDSIAIIAFADLKKQCSELYKRRLTEIYIEQELCVEGAITEEDRVACDTEKVTKIAAAASQLKACIATWKLAQ